MCPILSTAPDCARAKRRGASASVAVPAASAAKRRRVIAVRFTAGLASLIFMDPSPCPARVRPVHRASHAILVDRTIAPRGLGRRTADYFTIAGALLRVV